MKSSAMEKPLGMNIFKGGSGAGSSISILAASLLRSTTSKIVSTVVREVEATFWGTDFDIFAIVLRENLKEIGKG